MICVEVFCNIPVLTNSESFQKHPMVEPQVKNLPLLKRISFVCIRENNESPRKEWEKSGHQASNKCVITTKVVTIF